MMPIIETAPGALKFERQVCSRCGGSGRYSFNLRDGDTCHGCNRKGVQLTKRGAAAYAWFKEQRMTCVADLKPGMMIDGGMGIGKFIIGEIETSSIQSTSIVNGVKTVHPPMIAVRNTPNPGQISKGIHTDINGKLEVIPATEAGKIAELERAVAYQATLGKNGKPLKVKG